MQCTQLTVWTIFNKVSKHCSSFFYILEYKSFFTGQKQNEPFHKKTLWMTHSHGGLKGSAMFHFDWMDNIFSNINNIFYEITSLLFEK